MKNKIIIGGIQIFLDVEYDIQKGKLIVKDTSFQIVNKSKQTYVARRIINFTEVKYKILTFGSDVSFSSILPQGECITVNFQGEKYNGKVHTTVKGRIGSLGEWYKKHSIPEGSLIEATYIPATRTLELEVIVLDYKLQE